MANLITDEIWYRDLLVCPDCRSELVFDSAIRCTNCDFQSDAVNDLRAKKPAPLKLELTRTPSVDVGTLLAEIDVSHPEITYDGPLDGRDSRALISVMMKHLTSPSRVLDLGCGPRDQFKPITHLGHQYVGFDYVQKESDFLADAHAIPFQDASFDCVFSFSVFEHLHQPLATMHEVHRVLKPGGVFISCQSQGEPFHESFFHHTPWGLASLIYSVPGMKITQLWHSADTLRALSRISRYPKVIRFLLKWLDVLNRKATFLAPRKAKWPQREKDLDRLYRAGSICVCAVKSTDDV